MIHFTSGNLFELSADVRVNTVNCVGVMGAGIALAFKTKFPEMYRDYQKACKEGKVKPGQLHIWKNLYSEYVVNFPTKRHWREPSRYDDIEAGLIALGKFLTSLGRVRVTLPALGCGHGGLDWDHVSQMICRHLSKTDAEIFVFSPSTAQEMADDIRNGSDHDTMLALRQNGISIINPSNGEYPKGLRGRSATALHVKGNIQNINHRLIGVISSSKPSDREIRAAIACIDSLAQPGRTILTGYGARIERPIIRKGLENNSDVVILLSEGILNFSIRRDLREVWDSDRLTVISASKPRERWSPSSAMNAKKILCMMSHVLLITDPFPQWITKMQKVLESCWPRVFHINYGEQDQEINMALHEIGSQSVSRNARSGRPNIGAIVSALETSEQRIDPNVCYGSCDHNVLPSCLPVQGSE